MTLVMLELCNYIKRMKINIHVGFISPFSFLFGAVCFSIIFVLIKDFIHSRIFSKRMKILCDKIK